MSSLEQSIQQILIDISATTARQIAQAIRDAILPLLGAAQAGAAAAPAPARTGAKRGRGRQRPAKTSRRRGGRKPSYTQRDLDAVVTLISQAPGMRAEDYLRASEMNKQVFGRVLAKLRQLGAVKTDGEKRATTYRLP